MVVHHISISTNCTMLCREKKVGGGWFGNVVEASRRRVVAWTRLTGLFLKSYPCDWCELRADRTPGGQWARSVALNVESNGELAQQFGCAQRREGVGNVGTSCFRYQRQQLNRVLGGEYVVRRDSCHGLLRHDRGRAPRRLLPRPGRLHRRR